MPAQVVLASNRGPLSYTLGDDGSLRPARGGGGLVAGLSGGTEGLWVCAALTEGDRRAAERAPGGLLDHPDGGATRIRMLELDPFTFSRAYSSVANSMLWFLHHLLFDTARQPVFDARFARDWQSYVEYNAAFAGAVAQDAAHGGRVLVQDYHLTLVPRQLRELRPDLRVGHFSHTPWAPPEYFAMLPDQLAADLLLGLLGADRAGFLTRRWAEAFVRCCVDVLGAQAHGLDDGGPLAVRHGGGTTQVDVHPLGVDGPGLRARAAQPDVAARLAVLREQVGPRQALVRVDRTELSKNIVRGLEAYRELLVRFPRWRGEVVHLAFAYPSRHDLPVYREYTGQVQRLAQEINDEFGHPGWEPVLLHVQDDYPRSLAAYRIADVLLVNPVRDGMNLVAKEAPVLSDGGCALVLSQEAGAADELGPGSLLVNPFDVSGTADALDRALSMDKSERADRTARLAAAATALPPDRWLARQLDALDALPPR
ncbi:MAG: trehalose-6-phosphate synthase [Actinomycetes bacterium]